MSKPTIRDIQRATCAHYGVGRADMLSALRFPYLVEPRHIAMTLSRKMTGKSLAQIADAFNRDHSMVAYACQKIEARVIAGEASTVDALAAIEAGLAFPDHDLAEGR